MKPVVCCRLVFVVIGSAPDANVERNAILRGYLVRLLFKLSPFLADVVDMKSSALSMPLEQRYKGRSISLLDQGYLDGRDGSHALLIGH